MSGLNAVSFGRRTARLIDIRTAICRNQPPNRAGSRSWLQLPHRLDEHVLRHFARLGPVPQPRHDGRKDRRLELLHELDRKPRGCRPGPRSPTRIVVASSMITRLPSMRGSGLMRCSNRLKSFRKKACTRRCWHIWTTCQRCPFRQGHTQGPKWCASGRKNSRTGKRTDHTEAAGPIGAVARTVHSLKAENDSSKVPT